MVVGSAASTESMEEKVISQCEAGVVTRCLEYQDFNMKPKHQARTIFCIFIPIGTLIINVICFCFLK